MKIEEWNAIPKDNETDSIAIDGDLVTEIDGIAFLVQRKNDFNNIVCKRIRSSKTPITYTFETFRAFLQENNIQYIRIEGISHKYTMLELLRKTAPKDANYIKHSEQSKETGHTVYYVKTY